MKQIFVAVDPYLSWYNSMYGRYGGDRMPRRDGQWPLAAAAEGSQPWEHVGDCWTLTNSDVDDRGGPTSGVNSDGCGKVEDDRIVGGDASPAGAYPFNVALRLAWGLQVRTTRKTILHT